MHALICNPSNSSMSFAHALSKVTLLLLDTFGDLDKDYLVFDDKVIKEENKSSK